MTTREIDYDQLTFKGIPVGFKFLVDLEWDTDFKMWAPWQVHAHDAEGKWTRIDDDADFQWVMPLINQWIDNDDSLSFEAIEYEAA
jgi:hypothetical protein